MSIHLHIERLVLDGVAVDQPRVLRTVLEQELTTRLRQDGVSRELHGGGAVPHVHGGVIEIGHSHHPARLGAQIARAVYSGIGEKK